MTASASPARTSASNGDSGPWPMPAASSFSRPARAAPDWASESARGLPSSIEKAATQSATSAAPDAAAAAQRWRTTRSAHAVQKRPARSPPRARRRSSLGPAVLSTTGSSVSATATLTSGMNMPAKPMLRRKGTGSTTSASSAIATVVPLKTTARPACTIAFSTASSSEAPCARSSRQRITTSSA